MRTPTTPDRDSRPGMREIVSRHRIACFFVVTCAVTWGAWIPLGLAGHRVSIGFEPQYLLGLLGPMIGALVTTAIVEGWRGVRDLAARMTRVRIGMRWWLVAIGLPLAVYSACYVMLAAYSIFLLAPIDLPTWHTLGHFTGFPLTNALGMWLALVIVGGLGEETGWRGWLLPQLQRSHSPLVASVIVGVCWAAWHIPLFFIADSYRAMPVSVIPVFLISIVSASIFLTWLYDRGRASILLVAAFHGTYNLFSGTSSIATLESMAVIFVAAVLVIQGLRRGTPRVFGATNLPRASRLAARRGW